LVERLATRGDLPVRLIRFVSNSQLIDEVNGIQTLIIIDACRGGSQVGAISKFEWPDPRIRQYHNHSMHGIRLCNALNILERIGRLPPRVVVFGIDIGYGPCPDEMSPAVLGAVTELEETVFAEICGTVDERKVVVENSVAAS
jgi:hydrogenase maturation protease